MTASEPDATMPGATDAALDSLLAAWRRWRTLSPAQSEAMRLAILTTPAPRPEANWKLHTMRLNVAVQQVNRMMQDSLQRHRAMIERSQHTWSTSMRFVARAAEGWQPYLKLV
jgi:hypothetical protein